MLTLGLDDFGQSSRTAIKNMNLSFLFFRHFLENLKMHLNTENQRYWGEQNIILALLTLAQSGLPGCVRVRRPVMESLFSFLASRSRAICRPMAFISFLLRAEVMYMCISKKRPENIKTSMILPTFQCQPHLPLSSVLSYPLALRLPGPSPAWSRDSQTTQRISDLG